MKVRSPQAQLAVLYEHPLWFQPLFAALERRGLGFEEMDRFAAQVMAPMREQNPQMTSPELA